MYDGNGLGVGRPLVPRALDKIGLAVTGECTLAQAFRRFVV